MTNYEKLNFDVHKSDRGWTCEVNFRGEMQYFHGKEPIDCVNSAIEFVKQHGEVNDLTVTGGI